MRFITNLYTNGLQINVSMLGSFLYVMGCQIKYLRSMKGLMSLTRTRKHIKLKVLLLKFGVLHRLKWILSGTLLSGFHFFLVLYFNLTFFSYMYSSTQFKMVPILFLFPCSFSSCVCTSLLHADSAAKYLIFLCSQYK